MSLPERYRALADQHRQNLASLESGKVRIFAGPGMDKEISAQWIETYKRWITELEAIITEDPDRNA